MKAIPEQILICPRCRATADEGLNIAELKCERCGSSFFLLQGLPCLFPAGLTQRTLWNDLLAKFILARQELNTAYQSTLETELLTQAGRRRMQAKRAVQLASYDSVVEILKTAGLKPEVAPEFAPFEPKGYHQYHELMLRDWAWAPMNSTDYRSYVDENHLAREHALKNLAALEAPPRRVLVLGAGAGRLSWDLHQVLKPELTVALDSNPLLSTVNRRLTEGNGELTLQETRNMPHSGTPVGKEWSLRRPDAKAHPGFVVIAADAWALPFAEQSFDLVVTPWFVDICGKDFKQTLGVVDQMLIPGGAWLNTGPFLYPDELPEDQKYTPEELRTLLALSQFQIKSESFETHPYTHSPLNQRGRTEEVWSFVAGAAPNKKHLRAAGEFSGRVRASDPPPWLLLPHLAIPRLTREGLFPTEVANIERLIDGTRSINDLAGLLSRSIPKEHDPMQFVFSFLEQYVVER